MYSMETRHIQQRDRYLRKIMEETERPCLPPILPNTQSSEESVGRNGNNNFSNSITVRAVMEPKGTRNEYSGPKLNLKSRKLIAESRLPETTSDEKQHLTVNSMDSFSKKLVAEGLSGKIISRRRRKVTIIHMNRPGESGIASVVNVFLIQFYNF